MIDCGLSETERRTLVVSPATVGVINWQTRPLNGVQAVSTVAISTIVLVCASVLGIRALGYWNRAWYTAK
jgi:hypothetical protein